MKAMHIIGGVLAIGGFAFGAWDCSAHHLRTFYESAGFPIEFCGLWLTILFKPDRASKSKEPK